MISIVRPPIELFTGRKRLLTAINGTDIEKIKEDIGRQSAYTQTNFTCSDYLWKYACNNQPILDRVDRSDGASANNKIVINLANAISRNLSSYTFPKGISYLADNIEDREFVANLNQMMRLIHNDVVTDEIKWYQSICGQAFIYLDYVSGDEVPFRKINIPPTIAQVVYSKYNPNEPVYGFIDYGDEYAVYSKSHWWKLTKTDMSVIEDGDSVIGVLPLIEVPNNVMRLGDFEIALALLDGINTVASDSVNNIEDIVKSYLVLIGVEPDDVKAMDFTQGSVLAFRGQAGTNQSATFIHPSLDGTTVSTLRQYLESSLKLVTGMPDRDSGNLASSTGVAEDIKTGQSDRDAIANEKSLFVKDAERRVLDIVLKILRVERAEIVPDSITPASIDIDITRVNRDNILTKSQAMLNFKQLGMDNEDIIYFGNITNDVSGVASRMSDPDESMTINATEDEINAELTAERKSEE